MNSLFQYAKSKNLLNDESLQLPFYNSISAYEEEEYPETGKLKKKIRHYIRWNALVTVLKANKNNDLGGHISTYSSAATLYEVGFLNHFFRAEKGFEDMWFIFKVIRLQVYIQGLF